jgi:hypothetical protein
MYTEAGQIADYRRAANRHYQAIETELGNENPSLLFAGNYGTTAAPNGTKSGYPFLISNQLSTIQFGEFNDPSFFVKFSSFALWTRGAQEMHQQFLEWAASLGLVPVRPEGLSRVDFAFDFLLPEIDFDEDSFVTMADKDSQHRSRFKRSTCQPPKVARRSASRSTKPKRVGEIRFDGKRVVMRGKKAASMAAAAENEMGTARVPTSVPLAPRPGLEPGTYGLTVRRSTN